jgi:hypothetical protein
MEIYNSFIANLAVNIDKPRKRSFKGHVLKGNIRFESKNKSKTFKAKF